MPNVARFARGSPRCSREIPAARIAASSSKSVIRPDRSVVMMSHTCPPNRERDSSIRLSTRWRGDLTGNP